MKASLRGGSSALLGSWSHVQAIRLQPEEEQRDGPGSGPRKACRGEEGLEVRPSRDLRNEQCLARSYPKALPQATDARQGHWSMFCCISYSSRDSRALNLTLNEIL